MRVTRLSPTDFEVELPAQEILQAIHQVMTMLGGFITAWDPHRLYAECSFEGPVPIFVSATLTAGPSSTICVAFRGFLRGATSPQHVAESRAAGIAERFHDVLAGIAFQQGVPVLHPRGHLERLQRVAPEPLSVFQYRSYVEANGEQPFFLTNQEMQFLNDARGSCSFEFEPRRLHGQRAIGALQDGYVLLAVGAACSGLCAVFLFNKAWATLAGAVLLAGFAIATGFLTWIGADRLLRHRKEVQEFKREREGWFRLFEPFERAAAERQKDYEIRSRERAFAERKSAWERDYAEKAEAERKAIAAWESLYAEIIRRWRERKPGLVTEYVARLPPPNGVDLMPLQELHAKFYELYGGQAMREKLISEGHYESVVASDLTAALGEDRGWKLLEHIDEAVEQQERVIAEEIAEREAAERAASDKMVGQIAGLVGGIALAKWMGRDRR